jgi:hypothetical protein
METGEDDLGAALQAAVAPNDGIESMLAEQMGGCHEAALSCLARARRQELAESARTAELRTGARLMTLFTQQLGALERHRSHLRKEREAAEGAERAAALRCKFAEQDAEREAEEAVLYPERVAKRLAIRAALAGGAAPATDAALSERLAKRVERRTNGQGDAAEADGPPDTPPAPESLGATAVPALPAEPAPPLSRQQRRAAERRWRKLQNRM